jgi:stage V sporulation protein B
LQNNSQPSKKSGVKSSTKLFFSGVLVLTISNLLIKAIGLLFKIPMNHIVGDTGMGYYSHAYTLYTCFFMIATNGLPVALAMMLSESRSKGQLRQAKKIFRVALTLFVVVGFVGMCIMLIGAQPYSKHILEADVTVYCILAIAPTLFFISITSAYRGYFQGYQQMLPTAVSQLIESLCKLFLGIVLATYALRQGYAIYIVAAYAAVGLTVGAALGMVFLWFYKLLFREAKYDMEFTEQTGESDYIESARTILKRLAIIAIPITISSSVMSITNLFDAIFVERILQAIGMTQEAATTVYGNYTSLAVPMFNMPPYLIYPISYSIIPILTMARGEGDQVRANRIMESSLRVAVLIGLPCALGMATMSKPILSLFYKAQSVDMAWSLLTLLAPSTFFVCMLSVTNAILQANGFERKPLYSILAGAVVKIVSNYFLLYAIGMPGTPVSTFLCYLTATGMNLYFVAKNVGVMPKIGRVFVKPLIASVLCSGAALGCYGLLTGPLSMSGRVPTLLSIAAAVVVYVPLIFLLRAVTADDILLLPKGGKILTILKRFRLVRE